METKTKPVPFLYFSILTYGRHQSWQYLKCNHKSDRAKILPHFKDQSVPIKTYAYTSPKILNYKRILQDLTTDDLASIPPDCICANSQSNAVVLVTL